MSPSSADGDQRPFVGREVELHKWQSVLADPHGQAVLVQGTSGMGKSMLLNRMMAVAEERGDLHCGCVRYEVTPTDVPEGTMSLILNHAWEAAGIQPKSFDAVPRRLEQWRAFLNVFKIGDLALSLRRDPARSTRDQFLLVLQKVSGRLGDNHRLVIFVDPEKHLPEGSADVWRLVVRDLPEKVKIIFAQRDDDQLINNPDFLRLQNLIHIPETKLAELRDDEVDQLIDLRASATAYSAVDIRQGLSPYRGYPFAVGVALDLLASGAALDQLPADPEGLIAEQWKRAHELGGDAAWKLLTAYAALEVSVPNEVVLPVAELSPDDLRVFLNKPFLAGLLRQEPSGRRLFHVMLKDHRLGELSREEVLPYHQRAIELYRQRLKADVDLDALAALRLPLHVLFAEGGIAFVDCLIDECSEPLLMLSLLEESVEFHQRALAFAGLAPRQKAALWGNLGIIEYKRGNLAAAEKLYRDAMEIFCKLDDLEGQAKSLGNLGVLELTREHHEVAEKIFLSQLEILRRLPRPLVETLAKTLGNLGLIELKRDNLDAAERWINKALKIERKHGLLGGQATDLNNLGLIERHRRNWPAAEKHYQESLQFNHKIGRIEGQAIALANLGSIALLRGDRKQARQLWTEARDLFERIGMLHMVAKVQGDLDRFSGLGDEQPAAGEA